MAKPLMLTMLGLVPMLATSALGQTTHGSDGQEVSVAGSSVKTEGVGNATIPNLMKNGEGNGQAPAIETDKGSDKGRKTTSK